MPRPIRAAISAGALAHNLRVARIHAAGAKVWAVIKANAYGHGLERTARALQAADGFAVLDFQEADRLRLAGVAKPILMLEGVFNSADMPLLHKYALTPVIHNAAQLEMLRARPQAGDDADQRDHCDAAFACRGAPRLRFFVRGLRRARHRRRRLRLR